jgi:hypothetical protein
MSATVDSNTFDSGATGIDLGQKRGVQALAQLPAKPADFHHANPTQDGELR